MKKNQQNIAVIATSLTLFSAAIFGSLHWKNTKREDLEIEFPVTTLWHETLNIKQEYVAQISAVQHIEISISVKYLC